MESKKQEQDLQFSLWLFASILLHILIILLVLLWYFQQNLERRFFNKHHTMIPDNITQKKLQQILRQQQQKEEENKKKTPVLWKDLKKPQEEKLIHTLIPGRQAVTQEKKQEEKEEESKPNSQPNQETHNQKTELPKSIPSPQQTTQEPQQKTPEPMEPQQLKEEKTNLNTIDSTDKPSKKTFTEPETKQHKKTIPFVQEKTKATEKPIQQPPIMPPKTVEQRHDELKNQLLQDSKEEQQKSQSMIIQSTNKTTQSETTNNPTILKKKVTLQDLKLGFAKFLQEGNNDILIQQGNTNQPPDAQALRLITYSQQIAHTMRDAINAHHQYHLVANVRGTRPTYEIIIDRSGKLLNFTFIISSGNELLDKIIQEALKSIKLYPAMPQYITGDTYPCRWTFIQ